MFCRSARLSKPSTVRFTFVRLHNIVHSHTRLYYSRTKLPYICKSAIEHQTRIAARVQVYSIAHATRKITTRSILTTTIIMIASLSRRGQMCRLCDSAKASHRECCSHRFPLSATANCIIIPSTSRCVALRRVALRRQATTINTIKSYAARWRTLNYSINVFV